MGRPPTPTDEPKTPGLGTTITPGHTWKTPPVGVTPQSPINTGVKLLSPYVEVKVVPPPGPDDHQTIKIGNKFEVEGFGWKPSSMVDVKFADFPNAEMDGSWTGIDYPIAKVRVDANGHFAASKQPDNYGPEWGPAPTTFNGTPRIVASEEDGDPWNETPIPGGVKAFFRPHQT